ncbi:Rhodanese domain protein [Dokdonia sp. 4H-3-7-5]|nr:Rhodanese domain protein [Dokdonia sp. 4H-3-7-5]
MLGMQRIKSSQRLRYTLIAITLCFSLWSCNEATSQKEVSGITTQEVITVIDVDTFEKEALVAGAQLVDVRRDNEWERGHLENAKHFEMNNPNWQSQIETLDKSKPVYVYCAKGGRSAKCAQQLKEAGFITIYDLEGGINNWNSAGKPIQ